MTDNGIVKIHGRDYMTVAKRVELAHEGKKLQSIETDVLSFDPVVVRATVKIDDKTFCGISSVSLDTYKQIEKQNPYEVAETSAVGRALGFAGYGLVDSIASADEMHKAAQTARQQPSITAQVKGNSEPVPWEQSEAKAAVDAKTGSVNAEDREIEDSYNETVQRESEAKPRYETKEVTCEVCGKEATEKRGVTKAGTAYHGIFCSTDEKSHTRWLWN